MKKINENGIGHLLIIIVVAVFSVAAAGYFVWRNQNNNKASAATYTYTSLNVNYEPGVSNLFNTATSINGSIINAVLPPSMAVYKPKMAACKISTTILLKQYYRIYAKVYLGSQPKEMLPYDKFGVLRLVNPNGLSPTDRKEITSDSIELNRLNYKNDSDKFKVQLAIVDPTTSKSAFYQTAETTLGSIGKCL